MGFQKHNNYGHILIFYPETVLEYNSLINNVLEINISIVTLKNSYWNNTQVLGGKMFLDPDEFRIVISDLKAKG
ncbi:hypothetical protein ACM55G_13425 [Flavobacterium sp. LB3P122]|uniref:hypothetical protein n=1 Tax=Flavobacterium algoriphilum TaxID=3398738 RepID=UPI003A85EB2D